MALKCIILCATLALANAGNLLAPAAVAYSAAPAITYSAPISYTAPAITSQSSNIYRTHGNLGQISTYSKSIDTPFSSVRKADVRISNPGIKFAALPALTYSAPAFTHTTYAAPVGYAAPATYAGHAPLLGVAYSAAPAVAHVTFDSGLSHYAW